jgi:hypothetical protein
MFPALIFRPDYGMSQSFTIYIFGRAPQLPSPVIGASFKIGKYKPMLQTNAQSLLPSLHESYGNKHPDHGLFEGTDPKKSSIIGIFLPILRVIPVFSGIQPGGNGK